MIELRTRHIRYVLGANGVNRAFCALATGKDYCVHDPSTPFARVVDAEGNEFASTSVVRDGDDLTVRFDGTPAQAVIRATAKGRYLMLEVVAFSGDDVEKLIFPNVRLNLPPVSDTAFTACAHALNLRTNVAGFPGSGDPLEATCCRRFGFIGGAVSLVGCARKEMRSILKHVIREAPELPESPCGGPWALDAEINRGSYLFDLGHLTEETVDEWIAVLHKVGFDQVDFHGGKSFRYGDCEPNPEIYPRGRESMKAIVARLHAAGIRAGLHSYAAFIDKKSRWVTPVPDPRLGKDATFTLGAAVSTDDDVITVEESTENMSAWTGMFIRNSATIQVDDELITYTGVSNRPPYAFTGCRRGACGTRVAAHEKGARVHHLLECFRLFAPDGDSSLMTEVAAAQAELCNECGFDMVYVDAIDGSDVFAGPEYSWYYAGRFIWGLVKHLRRPTVLEMSSFTHHMWCVRSRMGSWDFAFRGHKPFLRRHADSMTSAREIFLPGTLGWFGLLAYMVPGNDPTFSDDIEYLCAKAVGWDVGFSIFGLGGGQPPFCGHLDKDMEDRFCTIIRHHETLRRAGHFSESVKEQLRDGNREFQLSRGKSGDWQFREMHYKRRKVERSAEAWRVVQKFRPQPLKLRIEAWASVAPYDSPAGVTLADFEGEHGFGDQGRQFNFRLVPDYRGTQDGVNASLVCSHARQKDGLPSAYYAARNQGQAEPAAAWSVMTRIFDPAADLTDRYALGVWVHGDGKGEVLNLQLRNPVSKSYAYDDRYILVDFEGWRYFELVEREAERTTDYQWPYDGHLGCYAAYQQPMYYESIESLGLWYNNVEKGTKVGCYLSPIRALPLLRTRTTNPAVSVNGRTMVFPVEMETGQYLEFYGKDDCKLFSTHGKVLCEVKPEGDVPLLRSGENEIRFSWERFAVLGGFGARDAGFFDENGKLVSGEDRRRAARSEDGADAAPVDRRIAPRARVTTISEGEVIA